MTQKITRSQWDQITKRVRLADFTFKTKGKCLVCGANYMTCPYHSYEDNINAIAEVKKRLSVE